MIQSSSPNEKKLKIKKIDTGEIIIVDICPGCWNSKIGRAFITSRLYRMGFSIVHPQDMLEGKYLKNQPHLNGCLNKNAFNRLF